jgi:hypothetical protein
VAPGFAPPLDASCNVPPLPPPPGGSGNINGIADLLNNSFNFPVNDNEFKFNGRKRVLHLLREGVINPQLDPVFTQFIAANNNNSMGKFFMADSLMENAVVSNVSTDLIAARTLNNSVNAYNGNEQLQKEFNDLYLNFLQNATLTASEITQAQTIAGLCPFTDGAVVYQARALLIPYDTMHYWNACELSLNSSGQKIAVSNSAESESEIVVYPNPASDEVFILIKESTSEKLQISLYDAVGKLMMNKTLAILNGMADFSVKEIPTGVYFYKLTVGNAIIKQERLVVVK